MECEAGIPEVGWGTVGSWWRRLSRYNNYRLSQTAGSEPIIHHFKRSSDVRSSVWQENSSSPKTSSISYWVCFLWMTDFTNCQSSILRRVNSVEWKRKLFHFPSYFSKLLGWMCKVGLLTRKHQPAVTQMHYLICPPPPLADTYGKPVVCFHLEEKGAAGPEPSDLQWPVFQIIKMKENLLRIRFSCCIKANILCCAWDTALDRGCPPH